MKRAKAAGIFEEVTPQMARKAAAGMAPVCMSLCGQAWGRCPLRVTTACSIPRSSAVCCGLRLQQTEPQQLDVADSLRGDYSAQRCAVTRSGAPSEIPPPPPPLSPLAARSVPQPPGPIESFIRKYFT